MSNRQSFFPIFLLTIVLLICCLMVWKEIRSADINDNEGIANKSWGENLLNPDDGFDDEGNGNSYGYSSFFAGFEFRFHVKNYRAMRDDDLSKADDMR